MKSTIVLVVLALTLSACAALQELQEKAQNLDLSFKPPGYYTADWTAVPQEQKRKIVDGLSDFEERNLSAAFAGLKSFENDLDHLAANFALAHIYLLDPERRIARRALSIFDRTQEQADERNSEKRLPGYSSLERDYYGFHDLGIQSYTEQNFGEAYARLEAYEGLLEYPTHNTVLSYLLINGLGVEADLERGIEIAAKVLESNSPINAEWAAQILARGLEQVYGATEADVRDRQFSARVIAFLSMSSSSVREVLSENPESYLAFLRSRRDPVGVFWSGVQAEASGQISAAVEYYYDAALLYVKLGNKSAAHAAEDQIRRLTPEHSLLNRLEEVIYDAEFPETPPPDEREELEKGLKKFFT